MTIRVEITADTAEGLASQLHEFVQTFVALAGATGPTPFDPPAEQKSTSRRDKRARVIDATAEEPVEDKAEEAVEEKPKATKAAKATKEAAPDEVTPDMVRGLLNKLRTEKGNEALGAVVTQFAPKFSEIPVTSYPKLYAAATRALAA